MGVNLGWGCALVLWGCGAAWAQAPDDGAYTPLRQANLTVWIVRPATPVGMPLKGLPNQTPMTYQEQTAGSFGTDATKFGTSAGAYGAASSTPKISRTDPALGPDADAAAAAKAGYKEQTSGSFGTAASNYGAAASDHGQTNGSFGTEASNYGTDASNHGQTVGSFGQSLSTVADAGVAKVHEEPVQFEEWLEPRLRTAFPNAKFRFVHVDAEQLKASMHVAETVHNPPDVVIFDGFTTAWPGPSQDVRDALESLGSRSQHASGVLPTQTVVDRHSRHMEAARAFAQYASEELVAEARKGR